jgi:hypothetical protein
MSLRLESPKRLTLYAIYSKEVIVSILSAKLRYLTTLQISHVLITLTAISLSIGRTWLIIPLRLSYCYLIKSKQVPILRLNI